MNNKYCKLSSLRNEADVEQSFVRRLLEDLGYSDDEIRPKNSLTELSVGGLRGQPQEKYRPDFALKVKRKVRWIVEAKDPDEQLTKHVWQPRAYSVVMNGGDNERPVQYYVLTNGRKTQVFDPNENNALLTLDFGDFVDGNEKFRRLKVIIARDRILSAQDKKGVTTFTLKKLTLSEINVAFAWCHQHIYKKDDISQSAAFTEFVKLIALKLMSDRTIRDKHPDIIATLEIDVPAAEVDFSLHWVESFERNSRNPINDILFKTFMEGMEKEIARGERRRIFEVNDAINLKPETIKGVVKRLEHIFLFGIDADLNGRLFETFLNATMRGKDLGQFFTPRNVIKLGVQLAQIQVAASDGHGGKRHDRIIDACCGSGGFLIDSLADMWKKIEERANLSSTEKADLKKYVADNCIVGVDVANDPKLARIARLNMYLHGDGGSRIFHLNALDKDLPDDQSDRPDVAKEKKDFRDLLSSELFDIVLTNPPFAKAIERGEAEDNRLLDQYAVGDNDGQPRKSVKAPFLFAERYYDLLRIGGKWITIIDDGILGGSDYAWFRKQLREWFLIRAVISLPGDAFQRSNARVKTSYLIAEKRDPKKKQDQGPVFMYPSKYVGIDDSSRQRPTAGDAEARRKAEAEIKTILEEYEKFRAGDTSKYSVAPARVADRLDVKNCLIVPGRCVEKWRKAGFTVLPLSKVLKERLYAEDELVTRKDFDGFVRSAVVRYDGHVEEAEEIEPATGSYAQYYPITAGDILISNIAASHGSIGVVPPEVAGCVVSTEYTVLVPLKGYDPIVLQLVLRSPEVRSEILLTASGANRTRAKWDSMKDIQIPYPNDGIVREIQRLHQLEDDAKKKARQAAIEAQNKAETSLQLRSSDADTILLAFKPPK